MTWPEHIQDIFAGDMVVALAYRTPAGGCAILPVTTAGMYDPDARTVSTSTSFGLWKKLVAIGKDPRVAFAFHTRMHGYSDQPHYVLVQGDASFPARPPAPGESQLPQPGTEAWNRFVAEPKSGRIWSWLGREYYDYRVPITVQAKRVLAWPNLEARGEPEVYGEPLPDDPPPPQREPAKGTAPRVPAKKYRKRFDRARHFLLAYGGPDAYPVVLPDRPRFDGDEIVVGRDDLPPGGRRAGFLAHWFEPKFIGQGSVVATGWLEGDSGRYAPHTAGGYAAPGSELVYALATGLGTKLGYRRARKQGFVKDGVWTGPRADVDMRAAAE